MSLCRTIKRTILANDARRVGQYVRNRSAGKDPKHPSQSEPIYEMVYDYKRPSKYVRVQWTRYQLSKYPEQRVVANKARGTHKKRTWKERIAMFGSKVSKVGGQA